MKSFVCLIIVVVAVIIIIIIIISFITVFAGVLFVHQQAQTMYLEHQSLKSIILFIH